MLGIDLKFKFFIFRQCRLDTSVRPTGSVSCKHWETKFRIFFIFRQCDTTDGRADINKKEFER